MDKVSLQAIRLISQSVSRFAGRDVEEVLSLFPAPPDDLRKSTGYFHWNQFAEWMRLLDLNDPSLDWMKIGEISVSRKLSPVLIRLTRMTMSLRSAYWLASHWFGPSLFPAVQNRFEDIGPLKIRQTLFVSTNLHPCPQIFQMFAGSLSVAPQVSFGLNRAKVEASLTGHQGIYEITFPHHQTLWVRLKSITLSLLHLPSLLEELVGQQKALREQFQILETERSEFKNLIEKFPDGVIIHSQGVIQYINPKLGSLLELKDLQSWIGRRITEFIVPQEIPDVRERVALGANRFYKTYEISLLKDGSSEPLQAEYTPLPIHFEGIPAVAIVVRDLADRKNLQAHLMLTDRMRSLGQLAAGVGHEINNPLFLAQLKTDQLTQHLKNQNDSAGVEMALEIHQGLTRIEGIVKQLKTFARGQDDENPVPVDVSKAVNSALQMARNVIQTKAKLSVQEEVVPRVLANEAQLGQVFLNLLINAAQAIPPGHPNDNEISISVRKQDLEKVVVEIKDTGSGIPESVRPHLFRPFYTTKAKAEGTGLGLSICQSIVSRYQGRIEFESEVGKGTVFRVTFPAAWADIPLSQTTPPLLQKGPYKRAKVLILDDEETLLEMLESVVSSDHEVVALTDAREALQKIANGELFDCVLCDLMMPQMDGMRFFQELKRINSPLCQKLIFITGGSFSPHHDQFLNQPGIRCHEKPIEINRLMNLIQSAIQESPA